MDSKYRVVLLTPDDVDIARRIRLEALQNNPEAFGSSYAEEVLYSNDKFREILVRVKIFGLFCNDKIVGSVGFEVESMKKLAHNGCITGMYVTPAHRGNGAGSMLLKAVVEYAKGHVMQLYLYCISEGKGAIKFYEKHGFVTCGIHPRALKEGDKFYDTNVMLLELDQ